MPFAAVTGSQTSHGTPLTTGPVMDETVLRVVPDYIWLWVSIEVKSKGIIWIGISKDGTCLLQGDLSQVQSNIMWQAPDFNRWWDMASTSLQIP